MKDKKILFGTFIALLLLLTTGLSYAYFSASISGNENAKNVVVEAGTLSLVYTDGPEIKAQNIKPGWSTTKEVSVKNTGTLDTNYNIIWQSLTNEITNDEMVISATCQRLNSAGTVEGTCESISQAAVSDMTIAKRVSIESGITHKYIFTILFKETNVDQNTNQGKKFNGVLGIEEYKAPDFATDSWSTIIANVKAGNGNEYAVGSTKEVDLGTTYGTHTLRIANTSTPSECSGTGFSQSACGFVLEFADVITTHKMNDTNTNVGGWPASSMYTFVNNDIYNALPDEIKNAIIDTTVVSG
ncbi:MAG: CalY family protein, partial [Clostridium sp.]|nr:CalY family protein [Clostridium sp.]